MPQGLLAPGNIDLSNRPRVKNADGSVSTVRSLGVNVDGHEVLIPTVIDGRVVSDDEAVAEYKRTGRHLGVFSSPEASTAYAQQLHESEAQKLDPREAIVQRMIDAGESEENIATVIQHLSRQPQAQPEPYRDPRALFADKALEAGKGFIRGVMNHPVQAGAMAGGLVAAPFTGGMSAIPAMAATGLAGAAGAGVGVIGKRLGEAAQTGDMHTPVDLPNAASQMASEGAGQALMEGGGRLVSGGLRALGSRVYQGILKPTKAARLEHPDLVQTALENRIPVSTGGAEKADTLMGQSRQAADTLVADRAAQPGAPTIDPKQAVGGIAKAVQDVRDLPVARPQMQAIGDYGRQYLKEHPSAMALPDAQRAVRATDKFFDSTYRSTMDHGNPVTSGNAAAAVGINDETRKLLRAAVPGLKEQNAVTSGLAGVKEAVAQRAGQQKNLSPIGMQHLINAGIGGGVGAVGGKEKGLGTFATMEMLTNPAIGSRMAIGGHMAAGLPWAQMVRAALLARLSGDDEEQPR